MDLNFSAVPEFLFSILGVRSLGRGKGKVKRGNDSLDSKILPIFFLRISFPREDFTGKSFVHEDSTFSILSFFLSFPKGRVLQRFTANLENVQTRERERERENGVIPTRIAVRFFYRWWYWKWTKVARFLDDVADLSPTDGSSIDFPASIPRTD